MEDNSKKKLVFVLSFLAGFAILFPTNLVAVEPISHWKFDGDANDSAGTNHGTLIGDPCWVAGYIGDWALEFDGSGDYVNVGDKPDLTLADNYTFAFWVKFNSMTSPVYQFVFSKEDNASNRGYSFQLDGSGGLKWKVNDTPRITITGITAGAWTHVAVTNEGTEDIVYVNGAEYDRTTHTSILDNTKAFLLGQRYDFESVAYLNGSIDDVRVYDRELSAGEILQLYQAGGQKASCPTPDNGEIVVDPNTVLSWLPGKDANLHDVYFGTDYNDVNDANTVITFDVYKGRQEPNFYDPCGLEPNTTYWWRIDEVNDSNMWKGDVWNFTTSPIWKNDINFPEDPFCSEGVFENDPRWVKFTIKLDDPCTVYFQDSKLYVFHYDFATTWLDPFIDMNVPEFFDVTLYQSGQLGVLGAVILPPMTGSVPDFNEYGIQFIRYDPYTKEEVADMFNVVKANVIADPCVEAFYFPTYEQSASAEADRAWLLSQGIPVGSIAQWFEGNICYSEGWAIGQLKYFSGDQIGPAYQSGQLEPNDILLTDGVPAEIPMVAGVMTLSPTTPNSHVAILARTYGIPFVYLGLGGDVNDTNDMIGADVVMCVEDNAGNCTVTLRDVNEFSDIEIDELLAMKEPGTLSIIPTSPLGSYSGDTNDISPSDIGYFGGKASNYGILRDAIESNCPSAMAISFDLWDEFLDQALVPRSSVVIWPGEYLLFWADNDEEQGPTHTSFKLSKDGEYIGLYDSDGTTLIDGLAFGAQSSDVSYGRSPDGNDNWVLFSGGTATPGASNTGSGGPASGLFVNEFMADNDSTIQDPCGSGYPDWIELYNAGSTAIDIGGMYLTDDASDPTKWMIPVGISGGTLREEIANRLTSYSYPPVDMAGLSVDLSAIRSLFKSFVSTSFRQPQKDAIIAALQDPNYGFDVNSKIRFRSSTNVEDSNDFIGAGLYDSYSGCLADDLDGDDDGPCICDPCNTNERGVFRAIRKVFASFYNNNAFLERLRYGVNPTQVGMALLVHHSFPDEFELANGVATLEKNSSSPDKIVKLVTQKGAVSVANPEGGSIPEEVEVYVNGTGDKTATLIRQSNLVILGETVMEWLADYNDLTELLLDASVEFENITGKDDYILDFEYKKLFAGGAAMPAGGLVVKQIREIPQVASEQLACPAPVLPTDCSTPCPGDWSGSYLMGHTRSFTSPDGVSIETSYCLYCPGFCLEWPFAFWNWTTISGLTTETINLYSCSSQCYTAGHHNWCENFYFEPMFEPGISQCIVDQLWLMNVKGIELHNMTVCGDPGIRYYDFDGQVFYGKPYLGDFDHDGDVDMVDFAMLAQRWLDSDCDLCGGIDLNCDGDVGLDDLREFVDDWLAGVEL